MSALYLIDIDISSAVPPAMGNLSSLIYLSLSECSLQGEFPEEIFQLLNLQCLDLMFNVDHSVYLPEFQKGILLGDWDFHLPSFQVKFLKYKLLDHYPTWI